MEPETIGKELVQAKRNIARNIELRCGLRKLGLRRTARSRKCREGSVLVAHRTRNRKEVSEVHLRRCAGRIAPFGIHVRKAQVVNPEGSLEVFRRSVRIRNNHEAHPVDARHGRVTHQPEPFFAVATKFLHDGFHERRAASLLQIREVGNVHREGVRKPVLLVAILLAFARSAIVHYRTEAPFIVIVRALKRAGTELQRETHRSLRRLRLRHVMDFHLERLVRR